ncbi:MAG: putative metalloprotease CJM1_0395 family protein [Planctomycetota bacterium]
MSVLSLTSSIPLPVSAGGGLRADSGSQTSGTQAAGTRQPIDTVDFSPEALEAASQLEAESAVGRDASETEPSDAESPDEASSESAAAEEENENTAAPRGADGEPLSDAEVEQVRELQARDLEVRQHEQAHVAAGGAYVTSGPNYQYQQGPDGKRYAVGGDVGIDVSAEDTPEKTIAKAQVVRQAALAPAEPSAQDLRVASQASQLEQKARAELSAERRAEAQGDREEGEARSTADSADGENATPRDSSPS